MQRLIVIAVLTGTCLSPLNANANPYAAYLAKFLGEYLLGKCLDDVWDSATGKPDLGELDSRLRAFEGALSQVDARLSVNIADLRRELNRRPTREEVRRIVLNVLAELEGRIAKLETRTDGIEVRVAQLEEVFGFIPTVTPSPLIRSSVQEGNPAAHPLTVEWASLLCESETSRLKIEDLLRTRYDDHPDVVAAVEADRAILQRVAACHEKVKEEAVKGIDQRMDLLSVKRLKPTHPQVRLVDDNLASLLWLRGVSKPIDDGPQKGRLAVPREMVGPKCSEILVAFHLAKADVTALVPLFRELLAVKLEGAPAAADLPRELRTHVQTTKDLYGRAGQVRGEMLLTESRLKAALKEYSPLHPQVIELQRAKKPLVGEIRQLHDDTETALGAALAAYVKKLQLERPTNARMLSYRDQALVPLNELALVTTCFDWDNRIAADETWRAVIGWESKLVQTVFWPNSIGMEFMLIPAGEFTMGSSQSAETLAKGFDTKAEYFEGEHPPHRVKISKPFYLGATEVTHEQYQQVMGENPSRYKGDPQRPVESVSWEDAVAFCQRLSEKEGKTYRLPTEAEWEYACRAGSTTKWCFGDSESQLRDFAWYDDNSRGPTHPVGRKKPNAWGLFDVHGNVWEWCADWYDADYYSDSPATDPKGPDSADVRVLRGGSRNFNPRFTRSACRLGLSPVVRLSFIGFRLARTP